MEGHPSSLVIPMDFWCRLTWMSPLCLVSSVENISNMVPQQRTRLDPSISVRLFRMHGLVSCSRVVQGIYFYDENKCLLTTFKGNVFRGRGNEDDVV